MVVSFDADRFAAEAAEFLAAQVETNIQATILDQIGHGLYAGRNVFAWGGGDDAVRWSAMRTPPFGMSCSPLPDGVAEPLMRAWLAVDPQLPWLAAPPSAARALALAWERLTGGRSELGMSEALHVLDAVIDPPRPASGSLRPARADELGLLTEWWHAFVTEADPRTPRGDQRSVVERRIAAGHMFVWEDAGAPVSTVGINTSIAGVVRIGPVYTPPELRGRGYASSAVAATSRRLLSEGAIRCMLYTDLANPTSNKIYAEVGYRVVSGWEKHDLMPA